MNKIYWAGYHPERSVQAKGILYLKKKLEEIYPNNLELKDGKKAHKELSIFYEEMIYNLGVNSLHNHNSD